MSGWFVLNLNPEPWRVGPVSVGRGSGRHLFPSIGRDQQLAAFQDAVRELLGTQTYITGEVRLTFYFWREQATYTGKSKKVTKHQVDATNMQKACEDALQGVFFDNDSVVRDVRSVVVEQGTHVDGKIVIQVEPWVAFDPAEIPDSIWSEIDRAPSLFDDNANDWPPKGGL